MGFRRIYDAFFHIDRENNKVVLIPSESGDLDEYIINLTNRVQNTPENRHFKFQSDHVEVRNLIGEIIARKDDKDIFIEYSNKISERLLKTEQETIKRYSGLPDLQKGSLVISLLEDDEEGIYFILISKVEYESFLNVNDLKRTNGLPFDKGVLKTCLVKLNKNSEIIDVILSDSNGRIATYWSKDFLELEELKSDETNTIQAFNAMEQLINRHVKTISPPDATVLRSHLVNYFRTQKDYNHEQMIEYVFGYYEPENPDVDIELLKKKARALPEQKKFDTKFGIVSERIKARIRKVVRVNDIVKIEINGASDDIKRLIKSEESNGERYIKIKTDNDEAFDMFNYRK